MDFSLRNEIPQDDIINNLPPIFEYVKSEANMEFKFIRSEPPSQNTYTFYLGYKGPIPGDFREVKVDVTFKENILFDIEEKFVIKTYPEYSDFPDNKKVLVYSLNEVATEKVCALFSKSRNEPRDLFDIYSLITEKNLNLSEITNFIFQKMKYKGASFEERKGEFEKKEANLKKLWQKRLEQQMSILPEFDEVFREVKKSLRQASLLDK